MLFKLVSLFTCFVISLKSLLICINQPPSISYLAFLVTSCLIFLLISSLGSLVHSPPYLSIYCLWVSIFTSGSYCFLPSSMSNALPVFLKPALFVSFLIKRRFSLPCCSQALDCMSVLKKIVQNMTKSLNLTKSFLE
ncbi:hypothetical protein GOODEAATRI_017769 [Goodea atripinnis]|uniref:NADH dehydrogenase subunit 6 n=1 Tax=Goodea atripinnis TaxID=208336 RepID=A0ABV0PYW7_9TELE